MSPKISEKSPKTLFAKRLSVLMQDKNFLAFERKCCLPNATVARYFDGQQPKLDALVAICMATGCDANWLLLGKGEPFPDKNGGENA